MSLLDLAKHLDLSSEAVRRLVRGHNLPSTLVVANIAKLFHVDAAELTEFINEDRCAALLGSKTAHLLFRADLRGLISSLAMLDEDGRTEVLATIERLTSPASEEAIINRLRAFLCGGDGAPGYAPEGLLEKRALSVEQLARKAGITRTSVYFYISNKKRPTPETLRRICAALDVTFEEGLRYCTPSKVGPPFKDDVRCSRSNGVADGLHNIGVGGASDERRRKTPGPTSHAGRYRMTPGVRLRASLAQRARWARARGNKETEQGQ